MLKKIIFEEVKDDNREPEDFTGKNWKKVSQELYVQYEHPKKVFRSSKLCREHWNAYLNDAIKRT